MLDSPPPPKTVTHRSEQSMQYCRVDREVEITMQVNATVRRTVGDDDVTKIMVIIDLKPFKQGYSLDLLNTIIEEAARAAGLGTYQIFHDPKGLALVGRP